MNIDSRLQISGMTERKILSKPTNVRTQKNSLSKIAKISIAIFDKTLRFVARMKKRNHAMYVV